jgi:uncharacterized protein (UPF0216 family)
MDIKEYLISLFDNKASVILLNNIDVSYSNKSMVLTFDNKFLDLIKKMIMPKIHSKIKIPIVLNIKNSV